MPLSKSYCQMYFAKKGKVIITLLAIINLKTREFQYQSLVKKTCRKVFQSYPKKNKPDEISYYRHSSFFGKFLRYDNKWYLEITPTYRYTWNRVQFVMVW